MNGILQKRIQEIENDMVDKQKRMVLLNQEYQQIQISLTQDQGRLMELQSLLQAEEEKS